jgi:hypothetical protein
MKPSAPPKFDAASVRNALDALHEFERRYLWVVDREGRSLPDASNLLGLEEASLRGRLHRVRTHFLKRLLGENFMAATPEAFLPFEEELEAISKRVLLELPFSPAPIRPARPRSPRFAIRFWFVTILFLGLLYLLAHAR